MTKVGRNDPCPCGSGKKYKQCCLKKEYPKSPKKFKASIIQSGTGIKQPGDLMDRTFGEIVKSIEEDAKSNPPPTPFPYSRFPDKDKFKKDTSEEDASKEDTTEDTSEEDTTEDTTKE